MGNTSSSQAQKCLESALGGNKDLVAFKNDPFFQIAHVKPYNLGIPVTPAAVTYPKTTDQISAIVKCAVDNSLKVQPRCGGHSYANYGEYSRACYTCVLAPVLGSSGHGFQKRSVEGTRKFADQTRDWWRRQHYRC